MNPAVLTRLDQLELEWQQRLLRQPSSGQRDKKESRAVWMTYRNPAGCQHSTFTHSLKKRRSQYMTQAKSYSRKA